MTTYIPANHTVGRRVLMVLIATALSIGSGFVFAQSTSAAPTPATFGRMPSDLVSSDGRIDIERIPDFISTVDFDGNIVGYVQRDELMPVAPNGDLLEPPTSQTVYARDGKTVVGRMDAGVGFTAADAPVDGSKATTPPTTIVQE